MHCDWSTCAGHLQRRPRKSAAGITIRDGMRQGVL